jgi:hypothetical protein
VVWTFDARAGEKLSRAISNLKFQISEGSANKRWRTYGAWDYRASSTQPASKRRAGVNCGAPMALVGAQWLTREKEGWPKEPAVDIGMINVQAVKYSICDKAGNL